MCNRNKLSKKDVESMVRVNHAGEYGARRIYAGQMAMLRDAETSSTLKHMYDQEEEHFRYFDDMISDAQYRPTAMMPLWHVLGFALGAGTALMGREAAMACTVAVEEVIDEHYEHQLQSLREEGGHEVLVSNIEKFQAEELEHRDIGLENDAQQAPCYDLLTSAIKTASRTAIWLSSRI